MAIDIKNRPITKKDLRILVEGSRSYQAITPARKPTVLPLVDPIRPSSLEYLSSVGPDNFIEAAKNYLDRLYTNRC